MRLLAAGVVVVLFAAGVAMAGAGDREKLVGTWVKEGTRVRDKDLPGDKDWELKVTFGEDGKFKWESIRKQGEEKVDESAEGRYSVEGTYIVYRFEKPSAAARMSVGDVMDYRPTRKEGTQAFHFLANRKEKINTLGEKLLLSYEAREIVITLKKQEK